MWFVVWFNWWLKSDTTVLLRSTSGKLFSVRFELCFKRGILSVSDFMWREKADEAVLSQELVRYSGCYSEGAWPLSSLCSLFDQKPHHTWQHSIGKKKKNPSCILSHIKLHLMFRWMITEALNSVCILYIYVLLISNSLSTGVSCLHNWRSALNKIKRALGTSAKIFSSYAWI